MNDGAIGQVSLETSLGIDFALFYHCRRLRPVRCSPVPLHGKQAYTDQQRAQQQHGASKQTANQQPDILENLDHRAPRKSSTLMLKH